MALKHIFWALFTTTIVLSTTADYDRLIYKDCGSQGIYIHSVDLSPMPIRNPGPVVLTLNATLKRPLRRVQFSLKIVRTIMGIRLPISCYKVYGKDVGSCVYFDLCAYIQNTYQEFRPENCWPYLAQYGIDCRCPFNIQPQTIFIEHENFSVLDFTTTVFSFMAVGDFNVTINARDSDNPGAVQPYACGEFLFTMKSSMSSG